MSYKVGLLLSMVFVAMFFLFGVDMINLQFMYTDLDQTAISVGYVIAKNGNFNSIPKLESQFGVTITCLGNQSPKFGDIVEFEVKDSFQPLVISKQELTIKVSRSTVIGFYE